MIPVSLSVSGKCLAEEVRDNPAEQSVKTSKAKQWMSPPKARKKATGEAPLTSTTFPKDTPAPMLKEGATTSATKRHQGHMSSTNGWSSGKPNSSRACCCSYCCCCGYCSWYVCSSCLSNCWDCTFDKSWGDTPVVKHRQIRGQDAPMAAEKWTLQGS